MLAQPREIIADRDFARLLGAMVIVDGGTRIRVAERRRPAAGEARIVPLAHLAQAGAGLEVDRVLDRRHRCVRIAARESRPSEAQQGLRVPRLLRAQGRELCREARGGLQRGCRGRRSWWCGWWLRDGLVLLAAAEPALAPSPPAGAAGNDQQRHQCREQPPGAAPGLLLLLLLLRLQPRHDDRRGIGRRRLGDLDRRRLEWHLRRA